MYKVSNFESACDKQGKISTDLKKNIWISFEHTSKIAEEIENEYWGDSNKRLHSYLDYTFRARVTDQQVKLYDLPNKRIGLFNTGLKKRNEFSEYYLVFGVTQDTVTKKQPYTLADHDAVDEYCMTKDEIIRKFLIYERDIPNRMYWERYPECQFDFNFEFYINWNNIFKKILNSRVGGNTRNIIIKGFADSNVSLNTSRMRQQLTQPFIRAYKRSLNLQYQSGGYIQPGLYLKKNGYDICLQLLLNVEYPKFSGQYTKFGVVLTKNEDYGTYEFERLLSAEMIYKNGRLIGKLPEFWEFEEPVPEDEVEIEPAQSEKYESEDSEIQAKVDVDTDIDPETSSFCLSSSSSYGDTSPDLCSLSSFSTMGCSNTKENSNFFPVFNNYEKMVLITLLDNTKGLKTIFDTRPNVENITQIINLVDFEFKNQLLQHGYIISTTKTQICQVTVDQSVETTMETNFNGKSSIYSVVKTDTETGKFEENIF